MVEADLTVGRLDPRLWNEVSAHRVRNQRKPRVGRREAVVKKVDPGDDLMARKILYASPPLFCSGAVQWRQQS